MAPLNRRTLDIRWLKKPRYRKFIILGSVIFSINVFLVHVLVNSYRDPSLDEEDPSGRGRTHVEGGSQTEDDDAINVNGNIDNQFLKEKRLHIEAEKRLLNKRKVPGLNLNPYFNSNKFKNSAVNLSPLSLKLEELDFTPECNVNTKEAVSAVHRAKTQDCKRHIVNVTCSGLKKTLYPAQLSSSCPAPGVTAGKALGCFQDDVSLRLLTGYFVNLEQSNSPDNCTNLCLQSGFPYAGVEYWTECFCGVEPPPASAQLQDFSCNMKCPSDPKLTCGGYLTINVFETGIVKFAPQVAKTVPEEGVAPVRITYLLTLSGRALRQVKRLIRSLYHKDHFFFIHIDVRQDYLFRELIYLEQLLPNVKLMRKRHATMWAGASLLQMLLAAMKEINDLPWQWDFILNLSESDFPIKKNEKLVEFLTANKGRNFVKSTGRDIQRFIQKQGLDKTFVECDGHMWRVGDRKLPLGIQMDGGSDWMALSRPFVQYVTSQKRDELLAGLDRVYRYTLLPAESFFHTVLRNSPFCDTYVDNNLHLTNWKRHLGCKCQYKHIVDWCGCSPNDFTPDDWPRITGTTSNYLYFARKFEAIISQGVINKLEEWVSGPPPSKLNLLSYWQSIYHYADLTPPRDDAVLSLCTSLARLVSVDLEKKGIPPIHVSQSDILELTAYVHDDVFQGILVKYNVSNYLERTKPFQLESWFKIARHFDLIDTTNGKFIEYVYVTSDFDVKELSSRSLHGVISPLSEFVVVYNVTPEHNVNLTFLFVDPIGQLAQVVEVHVTDKSQGKHYVGSSKVAIPQPLLPGVWEVRTYHAGFHVANSKFLVIPLQSLSGATLTERQASLVHGGSSEYRISADKAHWTSAVVDNPTKHSQAAANIKRLGRDLELWIDSLVKQFYTLVDSCHISGTVHVLEPCLSTVWSSVAPDPKSSLSSYDATTGAIS